MQPFQNYIGFLMIQIMREHRQRAEVALNKLGLHVGQEVILCLILDNEGQTQSQLAENLGVEPPTITKMLTRMGTLVERRTDSEDARISRIYLTEEGRALQPQIAIIWKDLEERTMQGLSEPEQLLLRRLLAQIRQNLA